MIDIAQVTDVEVEFDRWDYPDFCDAFAGSATYKGREMTGAELDDLNENHFEFIYGKVLEEIF